jgi:hypothetical protein
MACFRRRVAWRFAEAFGLRQRIVSRGRLAEDTPTLPAAEPPGERPEPVPVGA